MIVPFESVPMESVPLADAALWFRRMATQHVATFVMHEAGGTLEEVIANLRPALAEASFSPTRLYGKAVTHFGMATPQRSAAGPLTADNNVYKGDIGLHTDRGRNLATASVTVVALHVTEEGEGEVSAFVPTEARLSSPAGRDDLPRETDRWFRQGRVDDEVLVPLRYFSPVFPGSVWAFRLAGWNPLAHDVRTTAFPRSSRAVNTIHKPNQ